jgi:hypothetical protein
MKTKMIYLALLLLSVIVANQSCSSSSGPNQSSVKMGWQNTGMFWPNASD